MKIAAYAKKVNRKPGTIQNEVEAAEVAQKSDIAFSELEKRKLTWHLAELHAAPKWLWPALVGELGKVTEPRTTVQKWLYAAKVAETVTDIGDASTPRRWVPPNYNPGSNFDPDGQLRARAGVNFRTVRAWLR